MQIELKKWCLSDMERLTMLCNQVDRTYLSNRMPFPYTAEDAKWWLNMVAEHEGKDGVFRSISVNGTIIGNISVEQKTDVHAQDAEIGYVLLTESWSKGIMTEAVRQICEIAFSELSIIRITGLVYQPNVASAKVLEHNGFSLEGIMRQAIVKDSNIYDLCIYGKLKG